MCSLKLGLELAIGRVMQSQPTSQGAPADAAAGARAHDERGFALIELLMAILVIGILASVAIASYLNQTQKAQDTAAKSQARSLQDRVEDCATEGEDYSRCDTAAELGGLVNGIDFSEPTAEPPSEKVAVEAAATRTYTITATSKSGHRFSVERTAGGTFVRSCAGKGKAGCRDDGGARGVW